MSNYYEGSPPRACLHSVNAPSYARGARFLFEASSGQDPYIPVPPDKCAGGSRSQRPAAGADLLDDHPVTAAFEADAVLDAVPGGPVRVRATRDIASTHGAADGSEPACKIVPVT